MRSIRRAQPTLSWTLLAFVLLGCRPGRESTPQPESQPAEALEEDDLVSWFPDRAEHRIQVTPADGGWATVKNEDGYVIELSIPPRAVTESVTVTLTLEHTDAHPLHIRPGPLFRIEPSPMRLQHSGRIRIHAPQAENSVAGQWIFDVTEGGRATPLPRQTADDRTLHARIRHFSSFASGTPSDQQMEQEAAQLELPEASAAASAEGVMAEMLEVAEAMAQLAEMAGALGNDGVAADLYDSLSRGIERAMEQVLGQDPPADPCGPYLETLLDFGRLAGLLAMDSGLRQAFRQRAQQALTTCPVTGEVSFAYSKLDGAYADPQCGALDIDFSWDPARRHPFSQQDLALVGGGTVQESDLTMEMNCGGEGWRIRIPMVEELSWAGTIVIAESFETRVEFEIDSRAQAGAVVLEGQEESLLALLFERQGDMIHAGIPVYRDEQGVLRGIVVNSRVEDEKLVLDFDYADGARVEFITPIGAFYYILNMERSSGHL